MNLAMSGSITIDMNEEMLDSLTNQRRMGSNGFYGGLTCSIYPSRSSGDRGIGWHWFAKSRGEGKAIV